MVDSALTNPVQIGLFGLDELHAPNKTSSKVHKEEFAVPAGGILGSPVLVGSLESSASEAEAQFEKWLKANANRFVAHHKIHSGIFKHENKHGLTWWAHPWDPELKQVIDKEEELDKALDDKRIVYLGLIARNAAEARKELSKMLEYKWYGRLLSLESVGRERIHSMSQKSSSNPRGQTFYHYHYLGAPFDGIKHQDYWNARLCILLSKGSLDIEFGVAPRWDPAWQPEYSA